MLGPLWCAPESVCQFSIFSHKLYPWFIANGSMILWLRNAAVLSVHRGDSGCEKKAGGPAFPVGWRDFRFKAGNEKVAFEVDNALDHPPTPTLLGFSTS